MIANKNPKPYGIGVCLLPAHQPLPRSSVAVIKKYHGREQKAMGLLLC